MKNFEAKIAESEGAFARIDLSGYLDAHTVIDFDSLMRKEIEKGRKKIAIGMEELSYISSAGIGSLMSFAQLLTSKQGELVLFGPNEKIVKTFEMLGLNGIFQIARTQNDLDLLLSSET